MTDKLLCPFCQRKLKTWAKYKDGTSTVYCSKCNLFGDSKLFEELADTKKKLDMFHEFITKLYLNGDITDEQLHWLKRIKDKEQQ